MLTQILGVAALSALSGLLYRLGGIGKPYNTKYRDFGTPLCMVVTMLLLGQAHWALLICFGLMFGAMTTYWNKKDADERWWNWALHGFFGALAMLPLVIVTQHYLGFVIRLAVVTLATSVWSVSFRNVVWEECGRGVIFILTLPLLLV